MKKIILALALFVGAPMLHAKTIWIRPDGGNRTQCTGLANAAYPGSGTGVACAFNHPYQAINTAGTGWTNFVGGDTMQFFNTSGTSDTYFTGEQNAGVGTDWNANGLSSICAPPNPGQANGASCIMPQPPSGTAGAHTKIYGQNVGSCHDSGHTHLVNPTILSGIAGAFAVLDLRATNYVDISCIEVTQPDTCTTVGNGTGMCGNLSNFVHFGGLILNYLTGTGASNYTITDFAGVGIGSQAILGSNATTAGQVSTVTDAYIIGNGGSGWSGDGGGCNFSCESVGTLNLSHNIYAWNGCIAVHYDMTKSYQNNTYNYCMAQQEGNFANGDGFVQIAAGNGFILNVDHSQFVLNTQDGFDALHLSDDITTNPTINITTSYAQGNMGQTFKIGAGSNSTAINNVSIGDCRAMTIDSNYPLNPTGWSNGDTIGGDACRAQGEQWVFALKAGTQVIVQDNTTIGYATTTYNAGCITGTTCITNTPKAVGIFQNNTTYALADPGNSGQFASGWFLPSGNLFANPGGVSSFNNWFQMRTGCPDASLTTETNFTCGTPNYVGLLVNANGTVITVNPNITSSSTNVYHRGTAISGITTDYNGNARPGTSPSIGAFEPSGTPTIVSIAIAPPACSLTSGTTCSLACTATLSDSSTTACTSPVWTSATPAHATVNSSTGVVTGVAAGTSLVSAAASGFTSNNSTITVSGSGTAYTVTSSHRTMHVGDQVPPFDTLIKTGGTLSSGSSAIWSTPPSASTTATSASPVGTYTITVTPGTFVNGGDSATYTNGTLSIIAPDGIGASLVNAFIPNNGAAAPPSGFFSTLPWAVMDITSNPVQNCSTASADNTDCLQHLIAAARGAQTTNVKCVTTTGVTTVTAQSGTSWTGIVPGDGPVNINGNWFTVSSYTDATHMVLASPATAAQCSTTQVTLYLPRTMVHETAGSTALTWVSGPQFTNLTILNELLQLGFQTTVAKIASVTDATHLIIQTGFSIPNVTGNVPLYVATLTSGGGAGAMPLFIYVPCGQYKFSHAIQSYGGYAKLWGDGQCSELYLNPNSADFQTSSLSLYAVNPVNSNDTFDSYLRNLWFHVGVGNPKAIPLTFAPSNYGAIRNILISADDSNCPEGLNIGKSFTGPGAMGNVAIYGCQFGASANIPNHNYEGEYLTIEGQTTAGIAVTNIPIQIRKTLIDENSIPAATNTGAQSNFTFMDSEIFDNAGAQCIQNSTTSGFPASTIFLKNIAVHGSCTQTLNDYGTGTLVATAGDIGTAGVWTGTPQTLFDSGSTPAVIGLTVLETPLANDPAVSTWCTLGPDITTWAATISGCAATTVYLPPAQYNKGTSGGTPVTIPVPDTINHLQLFNAMDDPGATWHVVFTVAGTSATPLIIEGLPKGQCTVTHTGSRTVVLLDVETEAYTSSVGAGNLFMDDVIMGNPTTVVLNNPHIWARALNQEQSTGVKVELAGGTMWINGYKAEHNGANLKLDTGSKAEIYGGEFLGDPSPAGTNNGTGVVLTDASLFMTAKFATQCSPTVGPPTTCNYPFGNQFTYFVDETRTGVDRLLGVPGVPSPGSNQAMNMFYAFGAAAPVTPPTSFQVQGTFVIQGKSLTQ